MMLWVSRPIEAKFIPLAARAKRDTAGFRRSFVRVGGMLCALWGISLAACASGPRVEEASSPTTATATAAAMQRVAIIAKSGRFEPAEVHLQQGVPAVLEFTRVVDGTCMNAVRMPWMQEAVDLPMHEPVEIAVDTSISGVFSYGCGMGMIFGEVVIE